MIMETAPDEVLVTCEYHKCGKTFIKRRASTKKTCSDSCRVRKSRTNTKKDETFLGSNYNSRDQAPVQVTPPDFLLEIRQLSAQIKEAKGRSTDEVSFGGVLEVLLANFAAKMLECLLLGDPVNDKLDYLIKHMKALTSVVINHLVPPMGTATTISKAGSLQTDIPLNLNTSYPGIKMPNNVSSSFGMGEGMKAIRK